MLGHTGIQATQAVRGCSLVRTEIMTKPAGTLGAGGIFRVWQTYECGLWARFAWPGVKF